MSKKRPVSEKEKARRRAAAEAAKAVAAGEPAPAKVAGRDVHPDLAKPRIIRHQGR
jgi:hypothetical protein